MTNISQAAVPGELGPTVKADAALPIGHEAHHIPAPNPGATATLISDLRELFKVKVVALVLVTGWGGFYLGSMQSGISSMQRGLLDTLLGIGLVSAGAGALNEALERKTDAKMARTANRPLASGAVFASRGHSGRAGRAGAGSGVADDPYQSAHPCAGAADRVYLCGNLYAAQAGHDDGYLYRRISGSGWTAAGMDGGARAHRMAGRGAVCHSFCGGNVPHFMAISWMYRDDYAKAGIKMLPVVQPDGWSTVAEALAFAVIMIPVSLTPWWLGTVGVWYAVPAVLLGLVYLAYTIRFAGILRTKDETESRMLARDLLKVSVLYLPLLFTTLMLCATARG